MKRALLLEDSAIQAHLAMVTLQACGYKIERYDDIYRAEMACAGSVFDLYLVDVSVLDKTLGGEGDGLAFAARLRKQQSKARIVVWSANDHHRQVARLPAWFVRKNAGVMVHLKNVLLALEMLRALETMLGVDMATPWDDHSPPTHETHSRFGGPKR